MRPRPPGEKVANKFVLALVVFLVPWLAAAQRVQDGSQSIEERGGFESRPEAVHPDALHTIEATRLQQARTVETPLSSDRRKRTVSVDKYGRNENINDASAVATLAPAPAVRAPPPRRPTTESAGLTPPQAARSLEDWEMEDFVLLATVDGKLYARDRKTGKERWTLEADQPIIETTQHRRNRSALEDDYRPIDDYLWVVEPNNDGALFVYFRDGMNPGLVNTGLTMKKLVEEMSPWQGEEPPVVYNGEKRTTMITLDARTGTVLKWFGPGGAGAPDAPTCSRPTGLADSEGDECSSHGTVTLGRTEYIVSIHSKSSEPIATLRYSEWGPNKYDHDLHSQYQKTLDNKYVLSNYDGGIFAYDHSRPDTASPIFKQKFSSPVARVFDIARPWGFESNSPELVVLPQPVPPLGDDFARSKKVFLNHTETGSWFALSGSSYPLVTDGPEKARCQVEHEYWRHAPLWEEMDLPQLSKALVGLHSIEVGRPKQLLTISSPSASDIIETKNLTKDIIDIIPETPSLTTRIRQLPATATQSFVDFVYNPTLMVLMILLIWYYNRQIKRWVLYRGKEKFPTLAETPALAKLFEDVDVKPEVLEPPIVVPATPEKVETPSAENGTVTPQPDAEPLAARSRSNSADSPDGDATPAPKEKKKAHRGRRGGVKHRKNRERMGLEDSMEGKPNGTVEDAVQEAKTLGQPSQIEPDIQTVSNDVSDVGNPIIRLGSLEVNTEKTIGTGSNGTVVFEGMFDGRNVAVKRMLIQFFDIASQETKLLRESDDHPNVIRYYAQQQAGVFLYIALELCPASLADVIERPYLHAQIAQSGERDLPNVLYQITNGINHLHGLRIVHRDLKPQNILVSMGKDGKPRLLVSDFGLCKKLEGEQSSFRATTAHAAGTSGWRAPELLVDDEASNGKDIPPSTDSTASTSDALVSLDLLPHRRATRAIDIFSLGLVFFYVLTKGRHPFDCGDKYMREVNIRHGRYNLSELSVLGDYQHEAYDLISSMLAAEPKRRPTAREVMAHPFFWSAKKRLAFLCDVSDHFEKEPRDPPSEALMHLESYAPEICRGDFLRPLGKDFVESLGKQRKYTGTRLLDLLRALRNKRNHYEDLSEGLKKMVGGLPEGYLSFWTRRFPKLLVVCWSVVYEVEWEGTDRFREYYVPAGL